MACYERKKKRSRSTTGWAFTDHHRALRKTVLQVPLKDHCESCGVHASATPDPSLRRHLETGLTICQRETKHYRV